MARVFDSSPADRVAVGTTLRPGGLPDDVLRGRMGHTTGNIRLTPSAATVAGSASYNFGKVSDRAIGTYRLEWQGAASATAEELGAINRAEFTLAESTAGVYITKVNRIGDLDGGIAADAQGHQVNDAADELVMSNTAADNTNATPTNAKIYFGVVNSTDKTALDAVTLQPVATVVGDLVLNDASAASTRLFSLTKIS